MSLYSHGLSTREIKAHLEESYGVEVSPDLISSATEAVSDLVREWQTRPLEQAGIAKYGEKMDNADTEPESGDETVCDHF